MGLLVHGAWGGGSDRLDRTGNNSLPVDQGPYGIGSLVVPIELGCQMDRFERFVIYQATSKSGGR